MSRDDERVDESTGDEATDAPRPREVTVRIQTGAGTDAFLERHAALSAAASRAAAPMAAQIQRTLAPIAAQIAAQQAAQIQRIFAPAIQSIAVRQAADFQRIFAPAIQSIAVRQAADIQRIMAPLAARQAAEMQRTMAPILAATQRAAVPAIARQLAMTQRALAPYLAQQAALIGPSLAVSLTALEFSQAARRPMAIRFESARQILDEARLVEPEPGITNRLIDEVARHAAITTPPPLAADGLVEEGAAADWFAVLRQRVMVVSGLSERDLKEDTYAIFVFALTLELAIVLLLMYPLGQTITALLGTGALAPAAAASRFTRHIYGQLAQAPEEGATEDDAEDGGAADADDASEEPRRDA